MQTSILHITFIFITLHYHYTVYQYLDWPVSVPAVPVSSEPGLACWPPSSAGLAPSAWPAGLASPVAPCPQGSEIK